MYNIILLDDEEFILNTLKSTVKWGDLGFHLAASFSNSAEALDYVRNHPVHAVITDIKMPGISGIELSEILAKEQPKVKMILLSGYNDFEYAQSAIECGVFRYLLKPVSITDLSMVLKELFLVIESEEICFEESQERNLISIQKLLTDYMEEKLDVRYMKKKLHENGFQTPLPAVSFEILLTDLEYYLNHIFKYGIQRLYSAINQLFKSEDILFVAINYRFDRIKYIAIAQHDNRKEFILNLSNKIDELISDVFELLNLNIEVNYIDVKKDVIELRESREQEQICARLTRMVKQGDLEKFETKFYEFANQQSQNAIFGGVVSKFIIAELNKFDIQDRLFNLNLLLELYNKEYSNENVLSGLKRLFDRFKEEPFDRVPELEGNRMAERIKEYVAENYAKDISLSSLAEYFHINPSYLSRYFKQETGEKYIDYLNKVRLNKAVELLRSTNMKTKEIATIVGYRDINYFYKVFKNKKGMTPQQVRSGEED